jgi:hypothetical protein
VPKSSFARLNGFERYLVERCRRLSGDQVVRLCEFLDALERGTEPRTKEHTPKLLYLATAKRPPQEQDARARDLR